MLTDYHTHLRPDVGDTPPERYFTEANVHDFLEVAAERGITELGFSEHVYRFREALEVWRHPFWEECAQDGLEEYVTFVQAMKARDLPVKLGIEMDWIPGREDSIAALLEAWPWDYVVGSVHFLADGAVDHDGYDAWDSADPDRVWSTYFDMLGDAAASGLFDIVEMRQYDWEVTYDAESYIDLLNTFSGHIAMQDWQRDRLYGEIRRRLVLRPDGRLRRHWGGVLHIARRREG